MQNIKRYDIILSEGGKKALIDERKEQTMTKEQTIKEQIKKKIEERIEWLESQKDEIADELSKGETSWDMYETSITELNGGSANSK